MKFQYIAEYRGVLTRSHLCRLMGVSERGLHAWKHRPPSYRQRRDMVLLAHIRDQHRLSLGSYARPRMTEELNELYRNFYAEEPFVRVLPLGSLPSTAFVRGSNFCDIAPVVDKRTGRVIVVSAIDNLMKGASGQAVQNMNIVSGFYESAGLSGLALFP